MQLTRRALSELAIADVKVPPEAVARLGAFAELITKWNARVNLTAARTREDLDEHIADCLHVVRFLPAAGDVLDVGSGGGFPVVMCAIVRPDLTFVALEPVHKKHAFLRTAARELGLPLDARAERLEDHPRRDYAAATSRATFDLVKWLGQGAQRVVVGGPVIAMEGVARADLPPEAIRHAYDLCGKERAIICMPAPATAATPLVAPVAPRRRGHSQFR